MEIPNQLSAIARIIQNDWQRVYFGAVPYLKAMTELNSITDMYYEDKATEIVLYFLSNAKSWRGEVAKAVKAKLIQLLEERK